MQILTFSIKRRHFLIRWLLFTSIFGRPRFTTIGLSDTAPWRKWTSCDSGLTAAERRKHRYRNYWSPCGARSDEKYAFQYILMRAVNSLYQILQQRLLCLVYNAAASVRGSFVTGWFIYNVENSNNRCEFTRWVVNICAKFGACSKRCKIFSHIRWSIQIVMLLMESLTLNRRKLCLLWFLSRYTRVW